MKKIIFILFLAMLVSGCGTLDLPFFTERRAAVPSGSAAYIVCSLSGQELK
jgi:hypothetical protein